MDERGVVALGAQLSQPTNPWPSPCLRAERTVDGPLSLKVDHDRPHDFTPLPLSSEEKGWGMRAPTSDGRRAQLQDDTGLT